METEFEQWMRTTFTKPYQEEGWSRKNMELAFIAGKNSNQVQAGVIAKPEDCKGCAYNWGSFNTQPDDGYCYMFSEFMPDCKKYTTKL